MFTVAQLEQEVFEREGVRIVVRAAADRLIPGSTYCELYRNRIVKGDLAQLCARIGTTLTNASDLTYVVIGGYGNTITKMGTRLIVIRRSYTSPLVNPTRLEKDIDKMSKHTLYSSSPVRKQPKRGEPSH